MASRALVSYAAGSEHQQLLDQARPTWEYFAERFGYALELPAPGSVAVDGRSAHWAKIRLLAQLLDEYQELLWLDCDAMIVDFSREPFGELPAAYHQGLVLEVGASRWNPNTGVWLLRRHPQTARFLHEVWAQGPGPYWQDQAAVLTLLGWELGTYPHGVRLARPSPWLAQIGWLAPEWNVVTRMERSPYPSTAWPPRIRHFAGDPQRLAAMRACLRQLRGDGGGRPRLPR